MSDRIGQVNLRISNKAKVRNMLSYAKERYKVEFSTDFARHLLSIAYMGKVPPKEVVDAVYAEWKTWEPYIEPYCFHFFFQNELKSLFSLHAAATSSSCMLNAYIGNKVVLKDCEIPLLNTAINEKGHLFVNGHEVKIS